MTITWRPLFHCVDSVGRPLLLCYVCDPWQPGKVHAKAHHNSVPVNHAASYRHAACMLWLCWWYTVLYRVGLVHAIAHADKLSYWFYVRVAKIINEISSRLFGLWKMTFSARNSWIVRETNDCWQFQCKSTTPLCLFCSRCLYIYIYIYIYILLTWLYGAAD